MNTPRKLKSGAWNVQVYSHKENGKAVYKSITADTKAECEYLCAQFKKEKKLGALARKSPTLREAINEYIESSQGILSPTTISAYGKITKYAFQSIMDVKIENLNNDIIARAIAEECKRKCERRNSTVSPKTIKNEWMLVSSVLKKHNLQFNVRLPKVQHKNKDLPEPIDVLNAIKGTDIELPCLLAMWMSLRLSEVRGLTCDAVKGDTLYINQVKVLVDGRNEVKELAKTDASIRRLKIPPYILQMINNTPAMQKYAETGENGFIVPMPADTLRHKFYRLMQPLGTDISFHSLRHYFASISLVKLQIDAKTVQTTGGWSTPAIMQGIYNQSFNAEQEKAFETRNAYFDDILNTNIEQ